MGRSGSRWPLSPPQHPFDAYGVLLGDIPEAALTAVRPNGLLVGIGSLRNARSGVIGEGGLQALLSD
jgi:hypothetical protein